MLALSDYDYHLPKELIANAPASPRDSAKLFVYDTKTDTVVFDTFQHVERHLPRPSLLVFNDTKVVPARLMLTKETGGKVEVLLMMNEYRSNDSLLKGIADRKILPGMTLFFRCGAELRVVKQEEQFFFFRPSVSIPMLWKLLDQEGKTPIPSYIKNTKLSERMLREKYQSVFARTRASVAAPTASLHFTEKLIEKMSRVDVAHTEITLHVGLGTFAPVNEKNITEKKLFTEYFDVTKKSAEMVNCAKASSVPVIPVGTTAMRTLESAVQKNIVSHGSGTTNIFIYPPYEFTIADGLITNFHVPRSSLMLLVDALLKHKKARRNILELYNIALREKFRFYSFGDGMLIR